MEARDSSIYTYKSWLARFSFWIAREARENEQRDVFHRTGCRPFVFFFFFYSILGLFFFSYSPTKLVHRSYTQCLCLVWAPPPTCAPAKPPVRCNTHGTARHRRHGTSPMFFFSFYIANETSDCLFSLSLVHSLFVLFWEKFSDLPITHDRCWDG